jgi:MFS family permease
VLRYPNFRVYFCGSVTSDFGTWLQNTAQIMLAYRLTHSAQSVGIVICAQFSAPLVLGPWAGVITDRFGGRRTLLCTQLASALIAATMAALEFSGALTQWSLTVGAMAGGAALALALPARNVIVKRLVPNNETQPAYVMDGVSYNLGRATAPPLSVILVLLVGYGWPFAINAVTYLIFAACLIRGQADAPEPAVRSRVSDGFVIARRNRMIMFLLLMTAAITVADDPVTVLGPALANHLHASASWSGWFIAALGGGSVLGSLRRSRHRPSLRLASAALASLGVLMVLFVAAPWIWVSFFAALGAGVTCLMANSMTRTLLSSAAGPHRVGSVMAIFAIAWAGSKPLASLTDGTLASLVGVRATGILLALPAFAPLTYLIIRPHVMAIRTRSYSRHRRHLTGAAEPALTDCAYRVEEIVPLPSTVSPR